MQAIDVTNIFSYYHKNLIPEGLKRFQRKANSVPSYDEDMSEDRT